MAEFFGGRLDDYNAPADDNTSLSDYGNVLSSGAKTLGSNLAAGGRALAEKAGSRDLATGFRNIEEGLTGSAETDAQSLSPSALQSYESSITSADFWKHPLRAAALKATGMAPAAFAMLLPGGIVGDAAGLVAAGAAGGVLNASQVVDEIYKITDRLPDDQLREKNPFYAELRKSGMDETDAREMLSSKLRGSKAAVNFAVGALAGVVGPAGRIAKGASPLAGTAEESALKAAGIGAAEGAGSMAVQSGVANASTQAAAVEAGTQPGTDGWSLVNSVLEGGFFGGVMGGAAGLVTRGRVSAPSKVPATDVAQPPKGTGTGSPTPPATNVDVGSTVQSPTRSDVEYPKASAAKKVRTKNKPAPEMTPGDIVDPAQQLAMGGDAPVAEPLKAADTPAAGDTGQNVPEAPATIDVQRQQLLNGERKAVMYPAGTKPPLYPALNVRVKTPRGVFDYDPKQITPREIMDASRAGRENEILGLGPYNKADVAQRAQAGEPVHTVVEKTPEGVNVREAAGTPSMAPEQISAMEQAKTPGNTVKVEPIEASLGQRPTIDTSKPVPELPRQLEPAPALTPTVDVNAPTPKGRILEAITDKPMPAKARKALETAQAKDEEPAGQKGKNWTPAQRSSREQNGKIAEDILNRHPAGESDGAFNSPNAAEAKAARDAVLERAKRMVAAAESELIPYKNKKGKEQRLQSRLPDPAKAEMQHGPHMVALIEAKSLIRKRSPTAEDIAHFLTQEHVLRGGDRETALATRREKGDEAFRKFQGDVEAPVGDVAEGLADHRTPEDALIEKQESDSSHEITGTEKEVYAAGRDRTSVIGAKTAEVMGKAKERLEKISQLAEKGATEGERRAAAAAAERVKAATDEVAARAQEAVVKNFVTAGEDKAGKFKIEKPGASLRPKVEGKIVLARKSADKVLPRVSTDPRVFQPDTGVSDTPVRTVKLSDALRDAHTGSRGAAGTIEKFFKRRLSDTAGNVDVHVVASDSPLLHLEGRVVDGYYDPTTDHIVVGEHLMHHPKDATDLLLHEGAHAAYMRAIEADPLAARTLDYLREKTVEILEKSGIEVPDKVLYGFTNRHEFVSEVFGNHEFRKLLARVTVPESFKASLEKNFGMKSGYLKTVWDFFVESARRALGLPANHYSMLDATLRVSRHLDEIADRANGEQFKLAARDVLPRLSVKGLTEKVRDGVSVPDIKAFGRKIRTATDTLTMVSQRARAFGQEFGEHAMRADELSKRMSVERSKMLEREGGGLELATEGRDLARKYGDKFQEGVDIAFGASESNVNLAKQGYTAKNDHLGKDATHGWQAKVRQPKLEAEFRKLPGDLQDWILKSVKFGREERNQQAFARIETILEGAGVNEPGLANRIFNGVTTEADRDRFKSDEIVKHLMREASARKMEGWYFPFLREGDHVVNGHVDIQAPAGAHVTKLDRDTVQFMDPQGQGSDTRARRAAREWIEQHELSHSDTRSVWVDKHDPTQLIDETDPDAVRAYRVKLQNQHTSFHTSEKEALAMVEQLKGSGFTDVRHDLRKDNPAAKWGGLMPSQYESLISSLTKRQSYKDLGPEKQNELIQAMREANIKLLPGNRLQQRNLHRANVMGYSTDLTRSMAQYAQQSAGYLSKLKYQPQIDKELKGMRDFNNARSDKDNVRRGEIMRAMEERIYQQDQTSHTGTMATVARRLSQVSMLDKLGGASFHIINSMEPSTTTLPVLVGRHGLGAVRSLYGAYSLIGGKGALGAGLRDTARAWHQDFGFTDYNSQFKSEILKSVGAGERAERLGEMLDHLENTELMGHEAGMEVHRAAQPSASLLGRGLDRAELMSRQVGAAIEAINRAVSGLSAYELEFKRNGGDHNAAMAYAHEVVHDTMGNYSAGNAAPLFNSPVGRLALQFKKFAQKTYYLLGKTMSNAIRGDREAQKQFAGLMLTHGAIAGALGLPLEPIKVAMIASNALGLSPYNYGDFEQMVREAAAALVGKQAGEALTRGLPRLVGADLSARVGLESLLSFGQPRSAKAQDMKAWLFDTMAGAPIGTVLQQVQAMQSLVGGNFRDAADKGIPLKAARDVNRAVTGYLSGRQSAAGRETMKPYTLGEAALQAVGITPAKRAEASEMRSAYTGDQQMQKTQHNALTAKWVTAAPADKARVMSEIMKWNQARPKDAQIRMVDLQKALQRRKSEEDRGTVKSGMRINKGEKYLYENAESTFNTR